MADVPYPLSATSITDLKRQIWELIRNIYEEKIGGADLGDVFALVGDVLTLVLADNSGLTKSGNELAIEVVSTGGLENTSTGLQIKILSTGGLETGATGAGIKLDGTTLTLSAAGLKINSSLIDTSALVASRLMATDATKKFVSIDLDDWLTGGNLITIADDGDGTATASLKNYTVTTHNADTILTLADFKKIHTFDVTGGDIWVTLPSVAAANLGDWITLVRMGTANTLYIETSDADTILDSSAGGTIDCDDATYDLSTFTPWLLTATRWGAGPGCFGIWNTR